MGAILPLAAMMLMAFLSGQGEGRSQTVIPLPAPLRTGEVSLEATLHERHFPGHRTWPTEM